MVRPLPNWRSFFAERVALASTMVVKQIRQLGEIRRNFSV